MVDMNGMGGRRLWLALWWNESERQWQRTGRWHLGPRRILRSQSVWLRCRNKRDFQPHNVNSSPAEANRVHQLVQQLECQQPFLVIEATTHFHNQLHLHLTCSKKVRKAALLVGVVIAIDVPAAGMGTSTNRLQKRHDERLFRGLVAFDMMFNGRLASSVVV
jgi:hypothetical protein